VDYNVSGHWFANLDVTRIFLNTAAHIEAKDAPNPLVVGMGVGYRF
jgi:outer membrane protein W